MTRRNTPGFSIIGKTNFDDVRSTIALNEKILLKLDALAMEISASTSTDAADLNNELIGEIERLIDETRYYE